MKTPVKSKSKMRRATEEPKINMDGKVFFKTHKNYPTKLTLSGGFSAK